VQLCVTDQLVAPPPALHRFHFHHEGILGTSFDLIVRTDDAEAALKAERSALAEIERLRTILSTYDPASEVSRLNVSRDAVRCSTELFEVLSGYDTWRLRSRGAYQGQLGELIRAWRAAEKAGALPDQTSLAQIVQAIQAPAWTLDACEQTVHRRSRQPLNLDSLGKGYILGKAVAAARAAAPSVAGLLLNMGGDIFASGVEAPSRPWLVGVANPRDPADNAAPLTQVFLADRAISTSGGYERGYAIAGRRYSHILDPRTGWPAEGIAGATVVAPDSATANALATTLCVLKPEEGLALVKKRRGVECLILAANGEQFRSEQFAALEIPATGGAKKANEAKPSLWPKDFRLTLTVTLKRPAGGGYRRPFVAAWAVNEKGARVRTIVLWGNLPRYFPDLYDWSYGEKDRLDWAATIARATRPPGRHRVTWDGRDDSGNPVPPGTYTIFIEANRERGTYAKESAKIVCADSPAKSAIRASTEFEEVHLTYGLPDAQQD
jgi:thiamine biosynthesis lipoprotein ApbE